MSKEINIIPDSAADVCDKGQSLDISYVHQMREEDSAEERRQRSVVVDEDHLMIEEPSY